MIKKKIWGLVITFIIALVPSIVDATSSGYMHYDNIMMGDNVSQSSWGYDGKIFIEMDNNSDYSFDLKGYDLDENEIYVLDLLSDFMNYTKEYTGRELMDGITVEREDGDSRVYSRVYLKSTGEEVKSKVKTYSDIYEKVYFEFNRNFDSTEIDAYFKKIVKNGIININAVKPSSSYFLETVISSALNKYNTDKFRVYGGCDFDFKNCGINISDKVYEHRSKDFDVEYIYVNPDNKILSKVNKYLDNFNWTSGTVEDNLFILDDLENINYKYTVIKHGSEDIDTINTIINYSSEIQKMLEYGNLTATIDTRAGWGEEFTASGFGYLNLWYDNVLYATTDGVGVKQVNALYVGNNTKDTRDAYIKAALDRVQKYLPNAKVEITYAGQISELNMDEWFFSVEELVDLNKTLGEYYTLTIDGNDYSFFIVKDSSKMKNPEMNTVDLKTNIKINSDSHEVPLDAKINANVLDKNSKEYKDIIKKLKLNNGMVVDINLYSDATNMYITKLANGKFRVFVPLTEEYLDKNLNAYYIKDDGSIEVHEIAIEGNYGIFETDHFSTYTIGDSSVINPDTFDSAIIWIVVVGISLVGLIVLVVLKTKKH